MMTVVAAFAFASVAGAGLASVSSSKDKNGNLKGFVAPSLLSAIAQNPKQSFDVIVAGGRKDKASAVLTKIFNDKSGSSDENVGAGSLKRQFDSVSGGEMTLTGKQILRIAKNGTAASVMPNETVKLSGVGGIAGIGTALLQKLNGQLWPYVSGAPVNWVAGGPAAPTIAIVDSGVQKRADFGSRLLGQVSFASGANSAGDGYGHGTMVAGIAAGAAAGYYGTAPQANILSLDVMNDDGSATVSDVLKATDWILANRKAYNIKVANFSLHSANRASVMFDPLDQAVEKLWLNGVTVVAAAGNYGNGSAVGVQFAPGNDPFVITVGASDTHDTLKTGDDTTASFSAYGYTGDGFWKPDISAPGRALIGPVPALGQMALGHPDKVTSPGYMQLSGTSFSTPIVAAGAAMLAAQHPTWGPDQIKGALMANATPTPAVKDNGLGVGEVNIAAARANNHTPPNPNAGLDQFVTTQSDGTRVFDASSWQSAALANAAWNDVAWSDVAWSDAAWSDVAWSDVAWADVAWASAAWGDAAWSDAAWSDAAWADAAWADGADDDTAAPQPASPSDADAAASDYGITDSTPLLDGSTLSGTVSGVTGLLP